MFDRFHPINPSSNLPNEILRRIRNSLVNEDINGLFAELASVKENDVQDLVSKKNEIFERCEEIANKKIFSQDLRSKLTVASMFAVRMKVCNEIITSYESGNIAEDQIEIVEDSRAFVKNNYSNFLRSINKANAAIRKLNPRIQGEVGNKFMYHFGDLADSIIPHLDRAITVRSGTNVSEMSVPDVLARSSYVEHKNSYQLNVRELFQELWEVESLRPLLTVAAHLTQDKQDPLRMVFTRGILSGEIYDSGEILGFCRNKANIIVTSHSKQSFHGEEIPISKANIKGAIIHELHHFWEGLKHNNRRAPYDRSLVEGLETLPVPLEIAAEYFIEAFSNENLDSQSLNSKVKQQLNSALGEIKKINKDQSAVVESAVARDGNVYETYQPYEIFDFLKSYPENRVIQRTESVVRVPHVLGYCVGEGYSEEEVIKLMADSGLKEFLKLFNQEKEQMLEESEKISAETGNRFLQSFSENPDYLESSLVTSHPLDVAIKNSNAEEVLELCAREDMMKEFKQNPRLLNKSVLYLINLAKNDDSEHSGQALTEFKNIKNNFENDHSPAISVIFANARRLTMNSDITSSITPEIIRNRASEGSLSEDEDRFGNIFIDYAVDAYQAHKSHKTIYSRVNSYLKREDEWDRGIRELVDKASSDSETKLYGKNNRMLSDLITSGKSNKSSYVHLNADKSIENEI